MPLASTKPRRRTRAEANVERDAQGRRARGADPRDAPRSPDRRHRPGGDCRRRSTARACRGRSNRAAVALASDARSTLGHGAHERVGARRVRAGRRALNLYLDASALVKRYVGEDGSDVVRDAMQHADGWFICRVGLVETIRAISIAAGTKAADALRREWPAFGVIEADQALAEHAATLSIEHDLRSLDALHLAAALVLPAPALTFATWDRRQHCAARAERLRLLPESR